MAPKNRGLVFSAAPHPDESFSGYLTRLAEANYYQTPSWILQLAKLGNYARRDDLAFDDGQNFKPLSKLTGVDTDELFALIYRRQGSKENKFCNCLVFGSPVPRPAIHLNPAKVCPRCLTDYGYVRRIWELSTVTTCPLHECLLMDECPNCHRRLPFMRDRISICKCQYDWRDSFLVPVEEQDLELTRRVHSLCNLPGGLNTPEHDDQLSHLQLKDLLSAVSLVTSQYYRVLYSQRTREVDTLGRWLKGSIKNAEVHSLLCKAMDVFRDWPNNYFSFLEWRRQNLGSTRHIAGVKKDFGQFQSALRGLLKSDVFDFMREGFDEYLTKKWTGGYASSIGRLRTRAYEKKKYVSKQEASKLLGTGTKTTDDLVATGKLKGVITRQGRSRMMLIETLSIDELKAERSNLIDKKQTAKRLGINIIQTEALVRANLLTERDAYDGRSEAFYSTREIDALIFRTATVRKRARLASRKEAIDFEQALYHLACHHDIGVAQFIQAILDKRIKPCDITDKPGFRKLRFLRRDLIEYRNNIYESRYPCALNTLQAAKVLRTHPKIVRFLIKKNLLGSLKVRWWLTIPESAITEFCSRYILTQPLAKDFHTSTRYITNIFETEGIRPIQCTKIHHKPSYYVFTRGDIQKIDLKKLIDTKRQAVTSQSQLLDLEGAAHFLNASPEVMSQLIANGILGPGEWKGRQRAKKNYFTLRYLQPLVGKLDICIDLVSERVAAQLCGRSIRAFKAPFIGKERLNVIRIEGRQVPYFRRAEVEELGRWLKGLLRAAGVCALLKLSPSQLLRLTKSGELEPVSGPDVDRSAVNLFLKNDVERLRKQREAFKGKRAREGGSARFGKPAGPQRSPIMEMIAPRINVWLARAKAKRIRLSGGAIHRQLVHEGYKVGIASVYVYLQSCRV
jgi:hypothetical protein